jgi:hypothetical protein
MRSICSINIEIPTVDSHIEYFEKASLLDHDIVVFSLGFPYCERIQFSGGGSCISIEGGKSLLSAMVHWKCELSDALKVGKTVFVILGDKVEDTVATGYTSPRNNSRNYSTQSIDNYQAIPFGAKVRNAKGKKIKCVDSRFKGLLESLKDIFEYRVIVESGNLNPAYKTIDASVSLGGIISVDSHLGNLVLLPHLDFSEMIEWEDEEETWTEEALRLSHSFVHQIVSIDAALRAESTATPKPSWIADAPLPEEVLEIQKEVAEIETAILELENQKKRKLERASNLERYADLLFENGKSLEHAVEGALRLLGYSVSNFILGDLEIDHIFVGPSGVRMIGESEGRDSAAIDITKFRQLASNIEEDFAREDIELHAKAVLFGNGYRLTNPRERGDQFTSKCHTNAKRLGAALVRTADLYDVVVTILNNQYDQTFIEECRQAIEETAGGVVQFPTRAVSEK